MCGIAGVFNSESRDQHLLESMNDALTHRGPDEGGIYTSGPVGLAHRRLSIIDPETGRQPIFNEDKSVCTVFNGEIYNYQRLRKSLEAAGHSFSTNTDTEVLVHLYEEDGPSFVDRLEGMFAFALWDSERERLLLVRDPMGIKPLVVADDGESVAFASELGALLESNLDNGGIDEAALAQYFGLGYIPAPHTAFNNIRKLRPGEQIVISEDGIKTNQFSTSSIDRRDVSYQEAVEGLRTRIKDAVRKRLMSDVPLGAFLSGGIDSSIVVGTMANLMDESVQTFTVGFDEDLFDESWAAKEVADYHETDHTEYTVTPQEVRDTIPQVLDRLGEPFADQSIVPTYIVSRETSRDVKVALSGDGADELFAGYSRYRGEYYSGYYRQIPPIARNSLVEPALRRLDASRNSSRAELVRKAQKFLRGGIANTPDRHFEWARIADNEALAMFKDLNPTDAGRETLRREHARAEAYLPEERQDDMSRIQAVDTHFGLPNQILHKTDRASMYNSLEVRVPFLDTDVVEYAMSLPANYKITPRKQKRVLKRAFDNVLPDQILERNKQGFDMPIGEWFKDELKDEFTKTVSALDTDIIDIDAVMDRFADHTNGRREHGKFLWAVYVFARWHNRMTDKGVI
ncbi:asparagine synthase (glutamine-hydrolyzing) [Halobacterium sp. KA-6]|uniref:asparagine synthase (glutamine-hydrolyzing) n=1 Tax=Halobacterium sp. KA-6 TaxID=2896368 RepID=UPI0022A9E749|nr:asparagine synthase (glutamine-hydrolyzing) [Halobacterium sp. KA-6]